jgi:hypothetical protein
LEEFAELKASEILWTDWFKRLLGFLESMRIAPTTALKGPLDQRQLNIQTVGAAHLDFSYLQRLKDSESTVLKRIDLGLQELLRLMRSKKLSEFYQFSSARDELASVIREVCASIENAGALDALLDWRSMAQNQYERFAADLFYNREVTTGEFLCGTIRGIIGDHDGAWQNIRRYVADFHVALLCHLAPKPGLAQHSISIPENSKPAASSLEYEKSTAKQPRMGLVQKATTVVVPEPYDASTNGDAKDPRADLAPSTGRFAFQLRGNLWLVQFATEVGHFEPLIGFWYIAHLLKHIGHKFTAGQLAQALAAHEIRTSRNLLDSAADDVVSRRIGIQEAVRDRVCDEETILAVKKAHDELQEKREAARLSGDLEALNNLESEEKPLLDYLAKAQGKGEKTRSRGKTRSLKDPRRSQFMAAKRAIERCRDLLANASPPMPSLCGHMADSIRIGEYRFEYRPGEVRPDWHF